MFRTLVFSGEFTIQFVSFILVILEAVFLWIYAHLSSLGFLFLIFVFVCVLLQIVGNFSEQLSEGLAVFSIIDGNFPIKSLTTGSSYDFSCTWKESVEVAEDSQTALA